MAHFYRKMSVMINHSFSVVMVLAVMHPSGRWTSKALYTVLAKCRITPSCLKVGMLISAICGNKLLQHVQVNMGVILFLKKNGLLMWCSMIPHYTLSAGLF
jgi:hypothetical protein